MSFPIFMVMLLFSSRAMGKNMSPGKQDKKVREKGS